MVAPGAVMRILATSVGLTIGISQVVSAPVPLVKSASTASSATPVVMTNTGVQLSKDALTAQPTALTALIRRHALSARHLILSLIRIHASVQDS
jgi:hypothetical protein